MIAIEATSADEAWRQAARLLQDTSEVQTGRDQPTRELLHLAFTLTDPRQRLVFARPINPAFAIAEVVWILSGANASGFLLSWNTRMSRFVDDDPRVFHGAYGHRLGSRPRLTADTDRELRIATANGLPFFDQLRAAYDALLRSPESRQVVLQIWHPMSDLPNPLSRSRDVPCNLCSHLMIRKGRLEWLQVMRSNDLIWGTPYNFAQFTCLQEVMAGWLGVDLGSYVHVSDSLHVYQRHWAQLDALPLDQHVAPPINHADLRVAGYDVWERIWTRVAEAAVRLAEGVDPELALKTMARLDDLPAGYLEWIAVLTAESLRRRGFEEEAEKMIDRSGRYWSASWKQWAANTPRDDKTLAR